LTLAQCMRHDSLPALKSVRFIIEETTQNRSQAEIKKENKTNKDGQKKYLIK
jgi:hypothetical protein